MKALIAGGAGFLGSHLVESLLKIGNEVHIVDDLSSGTMENISHLMKEISFSRKNVIDFETKEKFDIVINLACNASRGEWEHHPVDVALSNALGSKRLIEISLKSDALYIFASSSEVYGNSDIVPTPETYLGRVSTTGSRSSYDEGKRFGDALTKAYEKQYGLKNMVFRFFNTYGPRMRGDDFYGRVVDRFVKQASSGKPITIYGDGTQTRSFTYVSDTVDAIIKLMTDGELGGIFNIGNDKEIKILELAEKVKTVLKSNSEFKFLPLPDHDPKRRAADITKLRILGWAPKVLLEEGIDKMHKYNNSGES
jgi:UDP-glucuronate decarboxylase